MSKRIQTGHRMPTVRDVAHQLLGQEAEAIARRIDALGVNPNRSEEELSQLPGQTPVRVLKHPMLLADYATEQHWGKLDAYAMLAVMKTIRDWLQLVDVDDDCTLTYDEASELAQEMQVQAVMLHRVNSVLHELMVRVADMIDDRGRLRFAVKKAWLRCEDQWADYIRPMRQRMERSAYFTLQDHLGLYADAMTKAAEPVYEAMRDRLIALHWQDIELAARIALTLRMGQVCAVTFRQYCADIRREHHIGLDRYLGDCDLSEMTRRFAEMCQQAGHPTLQDGNGQWHLRGLEHDQSPRVGWAWKKYMAALRDLDLQDEAALQAINLNPVAAENYREAMADEQRRIEAEQEAQKQREMEEGFKQLEEKFKVTKL